MRAHIRLGRIAGIEVGLHYSWFFIAFLIAVSLAGHFRLMHDDWPPALVWGVATLTAVLFFVSLLAHEFGHATVAKARGLPVRAITLFALGGIAQIAKAPASAAVEFWVAVAGPVVSVAVGFGCLGLATALGWTTGSEPATVATAMLVWLGYINLLLAAFNVIPGFPLDGGRILRGILWWATGDADRSMRIAAGTGQIVALVFIGIGVLRFFGGAGVAGLWLAFIGWFLFEAARASGAQVEITRALRGLKARDVMARDCTAVDAGWNLRRFVDDELLRTGRRCYLVRDDGRVIGVLTPGDVRQVARDRWDETPVVAAMRPLDDMKTVTPDKPVEESLEIMTREDLNQLPVLSNGAFHGLVSRANVLEVLRTRSELTL